MSKNRLRVTLFSHIVRNALALPRLLEFLQYWQPDIVYSNSFTIPIGAVLAWRLSLPHVWHLREFGELHYGLVPDLGNKRSRAIVRSAEAVINVSHAVRDYHFPNDYGNHIHVVHDGIAWETEFLHLFQASTQRKECESGYTFALLGRLHPGKGQHIAIKALAKVKAEFPDTRLILAGTGSNSYTKQLRRLIRQEGVIQNVELRGYVSNAYEVYVSAHAALMCSRHEGMGRVTAEAMASSLPVIGYKEGGTLELVDHERTGLLYKGGSDSLAQSMMRLMNNREWGMHLGQNGWEVARQHFTIERHAQQIYGIVESVL